MRAELQRKKIQAAQRAKRVRSNVRGSALRPRLSVYRSNQNYYVQLINDDAGKTLASASTAESAIKNVTELGVEIAKRAKTAKISKVVFDRGSLSYSGNLAKLAEAAREGGLDF